MPEKRVVLLFRELVMNEDVEEFVVERLAPGWRANIFPKSVLRSRITCSPRIVVARLGTVSMCLNAADESIVCVP